MSVSPPVNGHVQDHYRETAEPKAKRRGQMRDILRQVKRAVIDGLCVMSMFKTCLGINDTLSTIIHKPRPTKHQVGKHCFITMRK
jgi:hypothetical protein